MRKLSAIVVTYNSAQTIKSCLDSIKNCQIIVVDNASSDKTYQIIKRYFPKVKVIKNSQNLGFAKANNIGVKHATGEYILFLNPDAKIKRWSPKKTFRLLETNSKIAVVGPKLLYPNGSLQKEIRPFPILLGEALILLRFHRLPIFSRLVYPELSYELEQEVEHLMGAALLIKRKVFQKVKGFDENFFLWYEESDLLKRIKAAGFKVLYHPYWEVIHLVGHSIKRLHPIKKQLIWSKSLLYYFKKHHGWFKMGLLVPFILISFLPALFLTLNYESEV